MGFRVWGLGFVTVWGRQGRPRPPRENARGSSPGDSTRPPEDHQETARRLPEYHGDHGDDDDDDDDDAGGVDDGVFSCFLRHLDKEQLVLPCLKRP